MARIFMAAYTNFRRDPRVRREAEALVEAGHEVVFYARRHAGDAARQVIGGVLLITVPGFGHDRRSAVGYVVDYMTFFLQLFAHLSVRPHRYELLHVNNMPDFLVFAALLPRLCGTPVIHDVHDLMPEIYAEKFGVSQRHWLVRMLLAQERWAARFATAVITVEERLRDILGARGVAREKIHVLMNLPDDRIFKPRAPPSTLPGGGRFVIVYHGTLARRLGLDVAIRAVAKARENVPGVELRIIGAGEEREALLALSAELGTLREVTFSDGFVPLERIPALIADADAGVIPLKRSEGTDIMLPTKLLEYVSVGIPCLVPKTGTICRYFDADMVEFFEAEDVDSLAAGIVRLHACPERRHALASNATAKFGARFTWREHRKVYVRLVEALLARTATEG